MTNIFHSKILETLDLLQDPFFYQDLERWKKRIRLEVDDEQAFINIFKNRQEFRSVIKYRVNQFKCAEITKKFNEIFSSVSYVY